MLVDWERVKYVVVYGTRGAFGKTQSSKILTIL